MAKADSTPAGGKKGGGLMMGVIVPVLVLTGGRSPTDSTSTGTWRLGTPLEELSSVTAPGQVRLDLFAEGI